jgi:hypothetical protein
MVCPNNWNFCLPLLIFLFTKVIFTLAKVLGFSTKEGLLFITFSKFF